MLPFSMFRSDRYFDMNFRKVAQISVLDVSIYPHSTLLASVQGYSQALPSERLRSRDYLLELLAPVQAAVASWRTGASFTTFVPTRKYELAVLARL
jgi:hypothetical protein